MEETGKVRVLGALLPLARMSSRSEEVQWQQVVQGNGTEQARKEACLLRELLLT